MVTAVNAVATPAAATPAQDPVLSDLAQATLERLGNMHSNFNESAVAMRSQTEAAPATGVASGQGDDLARSVQAAADAFRTASQVQSQIVQFSMATSISQSLGNNLNSFLKGT
ncbi:hypothetical protein [Paracoccus sediminicola]|uniref:hypothetical protein n=1 Tax=Paracoccus sediminicola TaxID=3017783 RepID=UPI0022F0239E|nr:hypothetical protein [Paracoccus sediminicola]WBU57179.1 hypothetical protein PAF18_01660 [Paracoccus sediminicola]